MHALKLNRKVAVVTGASSGVGRSIALELGKAGASVAMVGRRLEEMRALAEKCQNAGRMRSYLADLENLSQIATCSRRILSDFGKVDILVHSAGVIHLGDWAETTPAQFDHQYRCNVRAPYSLTEKLLTSIKASKGQVVFINSSVGLLAGRGVSQYSATKHALRALADSLRVEVNSDGVRVVSIYLGRTATPMQVKIHQHEGREYHPNRLIQPEQVASLVLDILTTGREVEVTDVRLRPALPPAS